ncbi:hypothetical protein [Cellulomonas edaphi]|uniref:Uncharacterized protein n=1 Tax=Cellulomonas edaphi TaxID=3053468 RepID=A0ABT7S4R9_9CELL|nr:hypothetical protein [Cellulomons edaphi]MDM7830612.1 hypothetical protein [Cellulomons edaphi]
MVAPTTSPARPARRVALRRRLAALLVVGATLGLAACAQQPGPFQPFADDGPAADVEAIRSSLPDAIAREENVGRLVLDADGRATAELNLSDAAAERRRSELAAVAAPSRVAMVLPRLEEGVATLVKQPSTAAQLGYTDASFELDEFAGISVDGAHATAILSGKECYTHLDEATACGVPSRFRLTLARADDGRWLIERKRSQAIAGEG